MRDGARLLVARRDSVPVLALARFPRKRDRSCMGRREVQQPTCAAPAEKRQAAAAPYRGRHGELQSFDLRGPGCSCRPADDQSWFSPCPWFSLEPSHHSTAVVIATSGACCEPTGWASRRRRSSALRRRDCCCPCATTTSDGPWPTYQPTGRSTRPELTSPSYPAPYSHSRSCSAGTAKPRCQN